MRSGSTPDAPSDPEFAAERFRLAFEDSATGMALEDLEGRFLQVNAALCAMVGYTQAQLLGMGYQDICHPDDLEDPSHLQSLRDGTVRRVVRELRYVRADGGLVWVRVHIGVIHDEGGGAQFYTAQIEDIGQRRAAEQRFRSAFLDAAVGMAVTDLRGGNDDVLVGANLAMAGLLGRSQDELVGHSVTAFTHPADAPAVRELFTALRLGARSHAEVDSRYLRPDGTVVWGHLSASVSDEPEGSQTHLVLHLQDITARKDAEARLIHQAEHDDLTGLLNRSALAGRVTVALAGADRPALLFVDLDRFKLVNDTLGHPTGDELLIAVGARLRHAVREHDLVARIGGDEFVILAFSAASVEEAEGLAERVQSALAKPFVVAGRSLFLTASIGIALPGEQVRSAEDILRAADIAMYAAKTSGKARTAMFDASMRADADSRLGIEQDLHRAIATPGELGVWYQPVVSVATGRVVTAEALVRWYHRRRGVLLPAEFLSVAEETGLIGGIGRVVLATSLAQARCWADTGLKMVASVDLSRRQLEDPELEREITDALGRAGLEPSALCLEVTETVIADASSTGAGALGHLRDLGVAVAIDHFGQGHSSLAYLRSHPVDVVKIDAAFVAAVDTNPRDTAIVGAIIELAHALGMTCVAEGVERAAQQVHLADLGCDQIQGYLLGRPCPAADLSARLRSNAPGEAPSLVGSGTSDTVPLPAR